MQVSAITQDHDGYLWVGGYGGLTRFDGKNFKNYSKADGLEGSLVQELTTDPFNNVWIGTSKGLNLIQNGHLTSIPYFQEKSVIQIEPWKDELIILTDDSLFTYKNTQVTAIETQITPTQLEALNDTLFALIDNKIHATTDLSSFIQWNSPHPQVKVESITIIDSCITAIGKTSASIYRRDKLETISWKNGLLGYQINGLFKLKHNPDLLWVSTESGLNIKSTHSNYELLSLSNEIGSNTINDFFEDREGNLWLGTQYGLYKLRNSAFKRYGFEEGISGSFIFQITEDANHNMWVGTQKNGVFRKDRNGFTRFSSIHGLSSNSAKAICSFGDSVFVGTERGLNIIHKNRVKKISQLPLKQVNVLYEDPSQNLWIAGNGGFCKWPNIQETFVQLPDSTLQIWSMRTASNGDLVIGTYQGGLFRYNIDGLKSYTPDSSMLFETVLAIEEDQFGNQWYGTFEGIYMHNAASSETKHVTEEDGLNSKLIYTLLYDSASNTLWAGTNQGVNQLELSESGPLIIRGYDESDGFLGVECNSHGTFQDSLGNLWFGTVNGLISMQRDAFFKNDVENRTLITGFKLSYQDTLLKSGTSLEHDENNITISYLGLCQTNPEKVEYRYKLNGFTKMWSPATELNSATFSNLAPGNYEFQVVSKNNSGIWNETPTTFSFKIKTPFWQTNWFYALAALTLIGVLFTIVSARIAKIKKDAKLNQRLGQLKLQALRSQMNPHFLFNSLNSIQFFINNNEAREANRFLSKFAKLMRLMLDNSRTDAVKLDDEFKALELYLELETLRFEGKFDFDVHVESQLLHSDIEIPPMLIQPFVENAILHAFVNINYKGHIKVRCEKEQMHLKVMVEDNGIGREASAQVQQQKATKLHRSVGVTNIAERLETLNEYHKDQLSVKILDLKESGRASGTKVTIHIPIINQYELNEKA